MREQNKLYNIIKLATYIILTYLSIFLVGGIIQIIFKRLIQIISKNPQVYIKAINGVSILISGLVQINITKIYFYRKINIHTDIKSFANSFFICISLLLLSFILSSFFQSYTIHDIPINGNHRVEIFKSLIITGIVGFMLISISEEIIFRGLLLSYTQKLFNNIYISIIVSSFFFSVGHTSYHNIITYLIAFLGGLAMSISYLTYNNLSYPIGIHFSYDLFNFIFTNNDPKKSVYRPLSITYNKFHGIYIIDIFIILFFVTYNIFLLSIYFKIKRDALSHEEALVS